MIIYLDYKGTIVENDYNLIGRENFGWAEVVIKLQKAGHKVILNTSLAEEKPEALDKVLRFINLHPRYDFPNPIGALAAKYAPGEWEPDLWDSAEYICIDDYARGIPLKESGFGNGRLVNWEALDQEFERAGLYNLNKKEV